MNSKKGTLQLGSLYYFVTLSVLCYHEQLEAYNENETGSMHPVIFAARGEIDLRTGKGTGYLYYIDDEDQEVDYTEFDY